MKSQILVGVDGSAAGASAADWAVVRARDLGLSLNLVHAVPASAAFRQADAYRRAMDQGQELLDAEAERIGGRFPGVVEVVRTRCSGEPAESIRGLSGDAEMVVVGTDRRPDSHGEGFGSVSFQIAILSHCAVTIVPAAAGHGTGVVVGVDGSDDSATAVEYAAVEAQRMGEALTAIHATGDDAGLKSSTQREHGPAADNAGRLLLSASVSDLQQRHPGLVVHEALDRERPASAALVDAGAWARLVVMGCRGRGGMRALVGSVAQHVLLNIHCPTLVARRPGPGTGNG